MKTFVFIHPLCRDTHIPNPVALFVGSVSLFHIQTAL